MMIFWIENVFEGNDRTKHYNLVNTMKIYPRLKEQFEVYLTVIRF